MFIRRLPKFEYHYPSSVSEVLDHLARYGEKAKLLAGGTDLLVSMKKRERTPEHLLNLKGIEELKGIRYDGSAGLNIGALVTMGDLERSELVREKFPVLFDAVRVMASPQIRNLGTIGGNLCSAVPSADSATPLIVSGASLEITGSSGNRTLPVEGFFKGPGESALDPDEIMVRIHIPSPPEYGSGAYLKLMRRKVLDLALVGAAAFIRLDSNSKACKEARIALGAVAPTPIRVRKAEEALVGKEINETIADQVGLIASREASPISDIRSSKSYREEMIKVLTKRAVMTACKRVQ